MIKNKQGLTPDDWDYYLLPEVREYYKTTSWYHTPREWNIISAVNNGVTLEKAELGFTPTKEETELYEKLRKELEKSRKNNPEACFGMISD